MGGGSSSKYSCGSASETLEWIHAIHQFLTPYSFLINAHVVNFFNDRLWEAIDEDWIDCLKNEPVDHLLQIPSGIFQDHWPPSLQQFVIALSSLVLPRHQAGLQSILPNTGMTSLDSVLTQGMNMKKKHEVEVLSAVVDSIANSVGADTIVDVGSGQNESRSTMQLRCINLGSRSLNVPKTVTCRVMSADMLKAVNEMLLYEDDVQRPQQIGQSVSQPSHAGLDKRRLPSLCDVDNESSFVLAGLHACGDLSVTMLRTFLECKEVKAVVSIGCCYNLLSEEVCESSASQCGFPMSTGIKSAGLSLGKSSRDLACQSAERWSVMGKDAGLHNFELHAFRAAYQMVLYRYYPDVLITSPAIGRQGKALRRQQQRRNLESSLHPEKDDKAAFAMEKDSLFQGISSDETTISDAINSVDKYSLFEKFCKSGLCRLGLKPLPDVNFKEVWEEAAPFAEFIGPYWSLRAALGPLLETLILLDRLLFLQEQGSSVEAIMLPIFDPVLSPRNVAIIAKKRN
ncbi:protein RRNAD1-like [Vitis riparia]|uniref:protein RRNAD1-like n=1 Tax=Vitis riparia TaxID=96939 RepID=UPI00155B0BF0|nr:protein RRNAD1-like [Vitis riparia]